MIADVDDLVSLMLSRARVVALITWNSRTARDRLVRSLRAALKRQDAELKLAEIRGGGLSTEQFHKKVVELLQASSTNRKCAAIYDIEDFAPAAAKILNGLREQLAHARATVIFIRSNRERDFVAAAPDLTAWIGLTRARAESLTPITARDVNAGLRRLEARYAMSTAEFAAQHNLTGDKAKDDTWLWDELISLRESLKKHQ
jgi:hypothetical protein